MDASSTMLQGELRTSSLILPKDYKPCHQTVIIGRGRQVQNHRGNHWLRELIKEELDEYTAPTANRSSKSRLIMKVIHKVRSKSVLGVGFVKYNTKRQQWVALEDVQARTTVSQAFRDLEPKCAYRSSRQSKQALRDMEKKNITLAFPQLPTNDTTSPAHVSSIKAHHHPFASLVSPGKGTGHASSTTPLALPQASLAAQEMASGHELFDRLYSLVAMAPGCDLSPSGTPANGQVSSGHLNDPFEPVPLPDDFVLHQKPQGTTKGTSTGGDPPA